MFKNSNLWCTSLINKIFKNGYHAIHIYLGMSKKHVYVSFRTTVKNRKHLKSIKSKYNLTIGEIVHRMIEYFANSSDNLDKIFKNWLIKNILQLDLSQRGDEGVIRFCAAVIWFIHISSVNFNELLRIGGVITNFGFKKYKQHS